MEEQGADRPNHQVALLLIEQLRKMPNAKQINSKIIECLELLSNHSMHTSQDKIQSLLSAYFAPYKYKITEEIFCGRSIKSECEEIYQCLDCQKEENAILCKTCFDKSKHKRHRYKSKKMQGTCDCGDKSKWDQDGFCDRHYPKKITLECPLSQIQMNDFQQVSRHLFVILVHFYQILLKSISQWEQNQANSRLLMKGLRAICDIYGGFLMRQLIEVNKNRPKIMDLTIDMLKTTTISLSSLPHIRQFLKCSQQKRPLIKMLFLFIELSETSRKCVQLILSLTIYKKELSSEFTVDYIRAYCMVPGISLSAYRSLSAQLLSNSLIISGLLQKQELPMFLLQFAQDWPENKAGVEAAKAKGTEIYKRHANFITDQHYLLNLTQQNAINYWKQMCNQKLIIGLPSYTTAFSSSQSADVANRSLGIINAKYYSLQVKFLTNFISIINLLKNQQPTIKQLIKTLFDKLVKSERRKSYDLLFTYQRMWALATYAYLLGPSKYTYFSTIENDKIVQFFKVLKFESFQQDEKKVRNLLIQLLQYFMKIDCLFYDIAKRTTWESFQKAYFHSSNLLSSIDAIYFKILMKLASYIGEKLNNTQKKKSQCNHLELFAEQINQSLFGLGEKIKQSFQKSNRHIFYIDQRIQVTLGNLLRFISRLQECIYSELPDLFLSCKFPHIGSRPHYQQTYRKYYGYLVRSLGKKEKLSIQEFQNLAKILLFQQEKVMKQFIGGLETQQITSDSWTEASRMNFNYFQSLKLKLRDKNISVTVTPLHENLSQNQSSFGVSLLDKTSAFQMVSQYFSKIIKQYQINQYWGIFADEMVQQMWTLSKWGKKDEFNNFFKSFLVECYGLQFLEFLPKSMPMCLKQINKESHNSLMHSQVKEQSLRRKKENAWSS